MLQAIKTVAQAPPIWPELMNDRTLGQYLGVSPRTVWRMVATGDLPKPLTMPGGRLARWRKSVVDDAIERWDARSK